MQDPSTLEALSRLGRYADHVAGAAAGIALVMYGDDADTGFDEGRLAQNLMLGAWALGVGSCIGSIYPEDERRGARRVLQVPDGRHVRTVLSLGYPLGDAVESAGPVRNFLQLGRKPMSDFASWETFGKRQPPV